MQIHVSRTEEEAAQAQLDLNGYNGDINGYGSHHPAGGSGSEVRDQWARGQWDHSVAAGPVKVVGSDVEVFRESL